MKEFDFLIAIVVLEGNISRVFAKIEVKALNKEMAVQKIKENCYIPNNVCEFRFIK